ncbi:MAG: two-component system, NtrC family, response regulator HydG, partial [Acidobacteriota bacterium]|nr:two-component system, NtrC family, response regulator HydG [Acidobacteriota bacterium]
LIMDGVGGLEVLSKAKRELPDAEVVILTGHSTVKTAVTAMQAGATTYLTKPLDISELRTVADKVSQTQRLARSNLELQRQLNERFGFEGVVGNSPEMHRVIDRLRQIAPTSATVLITGESGTGKELVARAIHRGSTRRDRAIIQVNCAAIPEELIESELFGHEKGSFTGAVRKQMGKFVAADGGTIFLDEIGDMSARTQAKVLRVLQNGEVEPVGAERTVQVDVRVVAATNRNLEDEIAAGRFREDLFYRLNVIPVRTPALREHLEDLQLLVEHFVRRYADQNNYKPKELAPEALAHLKALPWKGNVRELKNLVERLLILAPGDKVTREDVLGATGGARPELSTSLLAVATLREFRDLSERMFLLHKLEENNWNVTQTAQAIDTPRSNLYKKLDQYAIHREEPARE